MTQRCALVDYSDDIQAFVDCSWFGNLHLLAFHSVVYSNLPLHLMHTHTLVYVYIYISVANGSGHLHI